MTKPTRAFRIDSCEARMDAERTPEGYIRGIASITRTGVFPYAQADGTVYWELRHPDDVFRADSLKTFELLPVQIEHNAMLDSRNVSKFKTGHTGEKIEIDSPFVRTTVILDDQRAVDAFEGGKREFSCGYYCLLVEESGVFDGIPYTHRQTQIEGNHLALCDMARLGSNMKFDAAGRFDSGDSTVTLAVRTDAKHTKTDSNPEEKSTMALKKIKLDSIPGVVEVIDAAEYEVEAYVSFWIDKMRIAFDSLKGNVDAIEAARDSEKVRADKAEADLKTEKEGFDAKLDAAVAERVKLFTLATDCLDEETVSKLDGMTNREIKEAVIKTVDSTVDLAGKSDEYVDARLDAMKATSETGDSARREASDPIDGTGAKSMSLDSAMAEKRKKNNPFLKKG